MTFDPKKLLPQHKQDMKAAEAVVEAGYQAMKPVMPDVLFWFQDGNWPVSHVLQELFTSADDDVVPHLRSIFSSGDVLWVYWVLLCVVPKLPQSVRALLVADLQVLATTTDKEFVEEEVHLEAQELLEDISSSEKESGG